MTPEFHGRFRRFAALLGVLLAIPPASASELKRDESAILYPALAWRGDANSSWTIGLHGWVGEIESRGVSLSMIRTALALDGVKLPPDEEKLFRERARLFLADNERSKRLTVRIGIKEFDMPATGPNGHFESKVRLPDTEGIVLPSAATVDSIGRWELVTTRRDAKPAAGQVHFMAAEGVSVISDIDDTIKVTEVNDREAMLRNTFCRPFRPVPGMAGVYAAWQTRERAKFHYVSASPWQLYAPLEDFRQSHGFPSGTFHLRLFRLKDSSVLKLSESPRDFKLATITPILETFPKRRFILVGDSGELDPEIFGELGRRYPNSVRWILIRKTPSGSNAADRFQKAFEGIPPAKWKTFLEPGELGGLSIPAEASSGGH